MNDLPDLHCTAPAKAPRKFKSTAFRKRAFYPPVGCIEIKPSLHDGPFLRATSTIELMEPNTSAIERAFQLAKAGQCANVHDIMLKLKAEGYSAERLVGSSLIKQLKAMISASHR